MQTTIRLDEVLARRMKELARQTDRSFTDLVEEAVTDLMAKHASSPKRKRVALPVYGGKRPVTDEQLRQAVQQADLEYDMKKIRRAGDAVDGR